MENLKELYSKNINIMRYFREKDNTDINTNDSVLVSYDYQAGSYTKAYYSDDIIRGKYLLHGQAVDMTAGEYTRFAAKTIADIINGFEFSTLLEVGAGESTTLCDVLINIKRKLSWIGAIELSLSRILVGKQFEASVWERENVFFTVNSAVGDMFCLPFEDNSIDLIYTYYCLDSHRDREKMAIEELLRVCKKYLILVEPSYELGNEATKERIDEMCYVKNMVKTISETERINVLEHRLFDIYTYNNNSAVTIIEKVGVDRKENKVRFACPVCKKRLHLHQNNFYCDQCYKVYPTIANIPILRNENAVLCSKYLEYGDKTE